MRLSLPVILAQLGTVVLSQRLDSGISEIDLVIPKIGGSYIVDDNHRFPLVWAVRNAELWTGNTTLSYTLSNYTSTTIDARTLEYSDEFKMASNESGIRYISVDVLLVQSGDYQFNWNVHHDMCEPERYGNTFQFKTRPNGLRTNLTSVADDSCSDRSALAFNIVNATNHDCTGVEPNPNGVPDPKPCGLKLDESAFPSITQALDAQFNKTCGGAKPDSSLCPQKKNSAPQLGMSFWLLGGLAMMAMF